VQLSIPLLACLQAGKINRGICFGISIILELLHHKYSNILPDLTFHNDYYKDKMVKMEPFTFREWLFLKM